MCLHKNLLAKMYEGSGDPQKNGLTKIADIEAYELYRNEAVEIVKKKEQEENKK